MRDAEDTTPAAAEDGFIRFCQVTKSFGDNRVLRGVDLSVHEGESVVVLGGSGSGKSVLLRHAIGLHKPDSGQVFVDGEEITHLTERALIESRKKVGMLFQAGALFDSMTVDGDSVRLTFKHTGGGLVSRDGKPLTSFAVAGEDREFVAAAAEIDGDTVVVRADGVTAPMAVHFGWHQEAEPNLGNAEGLPASPFRTDGW